MHLIAAGWIAWLANPTNWPTILAVAAGLGFVIFVHELGHFLVAKACGVKCEKFYLGFDIYGLKFCKFKRGETEYGIGILPLGGYVKMLGQDDNPARMAEEGRRREPARRARHRLPRRSMRLQSRTAICRRSRFLIRTCRTIRAAIWRKACPNGWRSFRPASL